MHFWVVNPFDQLPHETDVPLRYWTLCRMLAERGHEVVWWSSDFSHLNKAKRPDCPEPVKGPKGTHFTIRLIPTPPYRRNISLARLRNHRAFARGFYREATTALRTGELPPPDRILVSLPPLGVAEQAFRIRDWVERGGRSVESDAGEHTHPAPRSRVALAPDPSASATPGTDTEDLASRTAGSGCQVIVDIMDAWPEVFYQVLPSTLRKVPGPLLFAPLHRSARRAYRSADKISAVGQSYLDLAADYLGCGKQEGAGAKAPGYGLTHPGTPPSGFRSPASALNAPSGVPLSPSALPPLHLCYHGTDLNRFPKAREPRTRNHQPLKALYLGSMGHGYDLQTLIDLAAQWKAEGRFPAQIHFAGTGDQEAALKALAIERKLIATPPPSRIVFHGYLQSDAATALLRSADLALVPNRPGSAVACPYKAAEYAAAGLPMLSCLGGELDALLARFEAGASYTEGDTAALDAAFTAYTDHPDHLARAQKNARRLAERCFDRERLYAAWIGFLRASS